MSVGQQPTAESSESAPPCPGKRVRELLHEAASTVQPETVLAIAYDVAAEQLESADPDVTEVDLRCSAGKLLAKVYQSGQQPQFVHPDNLIELACPDCKAQFRKQGRSVARVLHRYNILGELIETLVKE